MMNSILSEVHRIVKKNVSELARGEFARVAAEIDRTAAFPWENFRKLARHGLTGMNVPERYYACARYPREGLYKS